MTERPVNTSGTIPDHSTDAGNMVRNPSVLPLCSCAQTYRTLQRDGTPCCMQCGLPVSGSKPSPSMRLSSALQRKFDAAPPHVQAGLIAYRNALKVRRDWLHAVTDAINASHSANVAAVTSGTDGLSEAALAEFKCMEETNARS